MRPRPDDDLLDTYEEEEDAVRRMHEMAEILRARHVTDRFGVFIARTQPGRRHNPWGLFLRHR